MKKVSLVAVAAAVITLSACATPRVPESISHTAKRSATVDYGDIDLATTPGRDELRARVATAAALVCTPTPGAAPFFGYQKKACIESIMADFAAKSDGLGGRGVEVRAIEVSDASQI